MNRENLIKKLVARKFASSKNGTAKRFCVPCLGARRPAAAPKS
jgi:hypothetical protein